MALLVNVILFTFILGTCYSKKQSCKGLRAECTSNSNCCSNQCEAVLGATKACYGKNTGGSCTKAAECISNMCVNNKCSCVDLRENCKTTESCCDFRSEGKDEAACASNGKCLLVKDEECENDDDCVGKCKNKECACHDIGEYCYRPSNQCCSGKCEDSKCK